MTARLIRLMTPTGVFLGVSALTYITLNGYRRFALPAAGDLAFKALPVVAGLLLAARLGIEALAWGVVAGAACRLLVHLMGLSRMQTMLAWPEAQDRRLLIAMLILMLPLVAGVLFSQVSELADNFFASRLGEGGVAAKSYARKIVDLPILILPYTLSVVVFPHFAHLASSGDADRLYGLLGRSLRGLAIVFAFLAVGVVLLAGPIVTLLLERGAFDAAARNLTAWPLRLYGLGLVTFALEAILVPFFYAQKDTVTPAGLGIAGVIVNVTLTALLIGPLGVGGVALALTLSKTLKTVGLGAFLARKRRGIPWGSIAGFATRLAIAAAVASIGIVLFRNWATSPGPAAGPLAQLTWLAAAASIGAIVFFGSVALLSAPDREMMKAAVRSGLRFGR